MVWLAAGCGYSGVPGAGDGAPDRVVDRPELELTTIEIRWASASGPVVGYAVFLDRDDRGFELYRDVTSPRATVSGESGHTVRVGVAAFDADGNYGPLSPISDKILFQSSGATALSEPAETPTVAATSLGLESAARGSVQTALVQDGDGAEVTASRFDFDGDATAELLWESPELGFFRITTFAGETLALFGRAGAGWERTGLADFDADGVSDVLWSDPAGQLAFTSTAESLMTVPTVQLVTLGSLRPDERVAATGDFDADGRSDVVVVDEARGEHSLWLSRDGAASQVIPLPSVAAEWSVADTGDFDGDGRADLLWARPDGLTLWTMRGADVRERVDLDGVAGAVASGDFDGDGLEDVARRDPAGQVTVLLMGSEAPVWSALAVAAEDALPAGTGDFDGDGLADLLWLRDDGAEIWFSEVDGGVDPVAVAAFGPEWALVGSGDS